MNAILTAASSAPPLPASSESGDPYLTPREAAALLKVKPYTLSRWRMLKMGPPVIRLNLRVIRYRRADVEAFMQSSSESVRAGR